MAQEWMMQLLRMSLAGGVAALVVALARLAFRHVPRALVCALWAVVLFRLICPVAVESAIGLMPTPQQAAQPAAVQMVQPVIGHAEEQIGAAPAPQTPAAQPDAPTTPRKANLSGWTIAAFVWALGALGMAAHGAWSMLRLRRRLRGAKEVEPGVYQQEGLPTAFVVGVLRPRIYLPEGLGPRERSYILLHERTHIRRGDHIAKLAGYAALCVHWFNPAVWLAYALAGRDLEMACDEAVIRKLGPGVKQEYSASLLRMAVGKPLAAGLPLAFGRGDARGRIRNVLRYRKPALRLVIAAMLAVVLLCAVLACDRPRKAAQGEPVSTHTEDVAAQPSATLAAAEGENAALCTARIEHIVAGETVFRCDGADDALSAYVDRLIEETRYRSAVWESVREELPDDCILATRENGGGAAQQVLLYESVETGGPVIECDGLWMPLSAKHWSPLMQAVEQCSAEQQTVPATVSGDDALWEELAQLFDRQIEIETDLDGDGQMDCAYWTRRDSSQAGSTVEMHVELGNGKSFARSVQGIVARSLFAADVTGDGLPELVAMADTGGCGGAGCYTLEILSMKDGKLVELPVPFFGQEGIELADGRQGEILFEDYNDDLQPWSGSGYCFQTELLKGFKLRVTSQLLDKTYDLSQDAAWVQESIECDRYDSSGEVLFYVSPEDSGCDGIFRVEPVQADRGPGCALRLYQYLYQSCHMDCVGFGVTTITWDEAAGEFKPILQEWLAELPE